MGGFHRRALAVLIQVLLLSSCGPVSSPTVNEEVRSGTTVSRPAPPPELIDALVGTWMPTDYCDCLFAKRSAFACGQELEYIYTMYVERHDKDSLRWSYVTTHEGGPEAILGYDLARSAFTYLPRPDEYMEHRMLQLRSMDPTTLEFMGYDGKDPQRFRRVASTSALLNEALLEGTYVDEDLRDTVQFTADGNVKGLPGLDQFTVLTDFTEGLDDRDIVFLSPGGDYDWNTDAYHYRHDGDALLLYPMLATDTEYVYRMDAMKYRLLRLTQ
jgi:hypothetical protein